jgi:hypothetical protein
MELIQMKKGGTINPEERGKRNGRWGDKETGRGGSWMIDYEPGSIRSAERRKNE